MSEVSESRSVVSDSLRPCRLYSPWNSPGQNTGVGSLSLLQGIFPTQGSNPGLPHRRRILYQLSYQGSIAIYFNYSSVKLKGIQNQCFEFIHVIIVVFSGEVFSKKKNWHILLFTSQEYRTSGGPVVKMEGARVRSLVGELRSPWRSQRVKNLIKIKMKSRDYRRYFWYLQLSAESMDD